MSCLCPARSTRLTYMPRFARMVLAATLAVLAGCHGNDGGTSGGDPETPAPVEHAFLDLSSTALSQEISRFQAQDLTAQLNELSAVELPAQRALLTWTGVEAELGGAAATDTALTAVANSVRDTGLLRLASLKTLPQLSQATHTDPAQLIQALRNQAEQRLPLKRPGGPAGQMTVQDATGQGANGFLGLGLTFIETGVASKLMTRATNNGQTIEHKGSPTQEGNNSGTSNLSATRDKIHYESNSQGVQDGLEVKLKSQINLTPCPDANGKVTVHIVSDGSVTKAGGSTGANTKIVIDAAGYYNDDAELASEFDYQVHVEQASFENNRGAFLDVDYTGEAGKPGSMRVNRASSQATPAHVDMTNALARVAIILAYSVISDTQEAMASGRCVKLEPTTVGSQRSGIEPSTAFQIFAAPRSQIDGGPVGGTVKANLEGGASINPANRKVAADATFAYTAPSEHERSATVSLEARSKRGIARASLAFDTKKNEERIEKYTGSASSSYHYAGNQATINISHVVWTLSNDVPGDQRLYMGSGSATVTVTNSGCSTASATMPVTGILTVFDPERADTWAKGYIYTLYTPTPVDVTVQCGSQTQVVQMFGNINVVGCDGAYPDETTGSAPAELLRYADIANLAGSKTVTCEGASDQVQWSFEADTQGP